MRGYTQTRKDYEFLYNIKEVEDCIAFADDEVFTLMENPTKKVAQTMYESGIEQWFAENNTLDDFPKEYRRRIKALHNRYLIVTDIS